MAAADGALVPHPSGTVVSRLLGSLALSTLIAAALTGCAGGVSVHESAEFAVVTNSGFLTGNEAAIRGTMTVTDEGCVGIADGAGNIYPAIWPAGTRLANQSEVTLDIPGVGSRSEGDAIKGSGGFYTATGREALREVADRCAWDGEVIGIRFD